MKGRSVYVVVIVGLFLIVVGQFFGLYQQHSSLTILSRKHSSIREDYDVLKRDYNALREDYNALEYERASLESEYVSLSSEYSVMKSEHSTLRSEYYALVSEYETLREEYAAQDSRYQHLNKSFHDVEENYEALKATVNQRGHPSDLSVFITPGDSDVSQTVIEITGGWSDQSDWMEFWEDVKSMYDWVRLNIKYRSDGLYPMLPSDPSESVQWVQSMWQLPEETLKFREGDCEDIAILLCSMIQSYGEERCWTEVVLITGSKGAHAGVQLSVKEDELTILDPPGNYYTKIIYGSTATPKYGDTAFLIYDIGGRETSAEINIWLNLWKRNLGEDVHVYKVFSSFLDKPFSSTGEYISWMTQR